MLLLLQKFFYLLVTFLCQLTHTYLQCPATVNQGHDYIAPFAVSRLLLHTGRISVGQGFL